MKAIKCILRLSVAAALLLSLPAEGLAKGRGGGSGGKGERQPATSSGQEQTRGQKGRNTGLTDQQLGRVRNSIRSAERIRAQAREMERAMRGTGMGLERARTQREQLRNELRTMEQEHTRLMEGLSGGQREELKGRISTMNQNSETANARFQEIDRELSKEEPNRNQVARQSREFERAMAEWQEQYRAIESGSGESEGPE